MTFSFSEYVADADAFKVSGKMEVYFRDDRLLGELMAQQSEVAAFRKSLSEMAPKAETAISRFLREDVVAS